MSLFQLTRCQGLVTGHRHRVQNYVCAHRQTSAGVRTEPREVGVAGSRLQLSKRRDFIVVQVVGGMQWTTMPKDVQAGWRPVDRGSSLG
jgi:hypothetical protein